MRIGVGDNGEDRRLWTYGGALQSGPGHGPPKILVGWTMHNAFGPANNWPVYSAPDPAVEAYSAPPHSLAVFKEPTSKEGR